jgi:hypothetical protein
MSEIKFGPWIEHKGDKRPVAPDTVVRVRYNTGIEDMGDADDWFFSWSSTCDSYITHYCVQETEAVTEDIGSAATSKHYNSKPIQPIELMQALMTPEEFVGFCKGNFIKYSMRAGSKEGENSDKDTNKAKQYHMWWQMAKDGATIDPRKHVV